MPTQASLADHPLSVLLMRLEECERISADLHALFRTLRQVGDSLPVRDVAEELPQILLFFSRLGKVYANDLDNFVETARLAIMENLPQEKTEGTDVPGGSENG
ncbi:MAG TPA: hypothetical protein VKK81_12025 [Candidatus Binatia bacterium]|nr:hypothetical protein [Candidatus Binatia bacterium]